MSSAQIDRQSYPHSAEAVRIATDRGEFAALDRAAEGTPRGTVLMVPGYTGSKEDFVTLIDPIAEQGYGVVAIDQRGQFETAGNDDPATYAVDELGRDVAAIARALSAPVNLLGHSFGGLVARAAVIAEPELFASLVLMASGPGALGDGPRKSMILAAEPHLYTLGLEGIYELSQQALAADPMFVAPPGPLAEFLRRRFIANSPYALQFMGHAMLSEPDRVAELQATGVPVLVLYGSEDNAWTPQAQSDMASRLGAQEVVIDGALHSPAFENVGGTLGALLAFWDAQRRERSA